MSLGKQLGPFLQLFRNPFKGLVHHSESMPLETILKEFQYIPTDDLDYNHVLGKLLRLGSDLNFKLAILNHDWEMGQLQVERSEITKHVAGLNFDIQLLFWYTCQLATLSVPTLGNLKDTHEWLVPLAGDFMEVACNIDKDLFVGYLADKSLGNGVSRKDLDSARLQGQVSCVQYEIQDFSEGRDDFSHAEFVDWASTVYTKLTIPEISRIKYMSMALTATLDRFAGISEPGFSDVDSLVIAMLYILTVGHNSRDVWTILETDANARDHFKIKHPNGDDLAFARFRDSNLITNNYSTTYAVKALS